MVQQQQCGAAAAAAGARRSALTRTRVLGSSSGGNADAADEFGGQEGREGREGKVFKSGESVLVQIEGFGPLGASVSILSGDAIPDLLGTGLVLQSEISKFRAKRGNEDVVVGERLNAFVQRVRDDGKVDIGMFPVGVSKLIQAKHRILDKLEEDGGGGVLDLGEKSPPGKIEESFPGMSKSAFKKALGMLFKEKLIEKPMPEEVRLVAKKGK